MWPIFILGFFLLLNFFGNCFSKGQVFFTKMNTYFRKSGLKITLVILGFIYIPITTSILEILFCKKCNCPKNQIINRLPPSELNFEVIKPFAVPSICMACIVDAQCTLNVCPGESDLLLASNTAYSCTLEMYKYFLPGSILLLFAFTLGVPVLFHRLVKTISHFLDQINIVNSPTEDFWSILVHISDNSCVSMYNSYVMKWKYYKLVLMMYRLFVVVIYVFLNSFEFSVVTSICLLLAHCIAFLFSLYSKPYMLKRYQYLFYTTILINIMNCLLVILKASDIPISDFLVIPTVLTNSLLPLLMSLIGYIFDKKQEESLKSSNSYSNNNLQGFLKYVENEDRVKIKSMDAILNRKLLSMTVNYFIVLGLVALVSCGIGMLGIVSQSSKLKTKFDTREFG
eukprot:NODE_343_length_9136_cov_0.948656.p2 type:complete len:398 gc:universal NODE_343_length_9136_cov_0.948656:2407-1214(-)